MKLRSLSEFQTGCGAFLYICLVCEKFEHFPEILNSPVTGRILGYGGRQQMAGLAACVIAGSQITLTVADHDGVFRSAAVFSIR